ncbi:Glutamine amidotransferase, class I [hydrothermal vent metagenome]|uniref:Glutamine amidotransferase, class I n=1 Tax=hydrothermal vent metagenome TaxID=652676 RepID=A0A3B0SZI1_9ZZZZ
MKKPIIGISSRPRRLTTSQGESRVYTLQHTYRDAVARAGGIPLSLPAIDVEDVDAMLDALDGMILSGGGDINPTAWGGIRTDEVYGVSDERDTFEIALAREAHKRSMPTLAICRGMQVINVAFGGTLITDIPATLGTEHMMKGDAVLDTFQTVRLEEGSRVAEITGTTVLAVNSIHHQAVDTAGDGFRVVGRSDDGVVEAIEFEDTSWPLTAVQWHPEYLDQVDDKHSRLLFEALVTDATPV